MSNISRLVFEIQELYEQGETVQYISEQLAIPQDFVEDVVSSIWEY